MLAQCPPYKYKPSRVCSVRLSPNIRGLARPSRSAPTLPCSIDDNFSAAQNEAKQLCRLKARTCAVASLALL